MKFWSVTSKAQLTATFSGVDFPPSFVVGQVELENHLQRFWFTPYSDLMVKIPWEQHRSPLVRLSTRKQKLLFQHAVDISTLALNSNAD